MPCLFFSQPLIIFPFRSEPGVENWLSWISWSLSLFLSLALLYGPPFLLYFCNFLFCFILHYSFRRLFSLYLLIPVLTIMKATTTGGMAFSPFPPHIFYRNAVVCCVNQKREGKQKWRRRRQVNNHGKIYIYKYTVVVIPLCRLPRNLKWKRKQNKRRGETKIKACENRANALIIMWFLLLLFSVGDKFETRVSLIIRGLRVSGSFLPPPCDWDGRRRLRKKERDSLYNHLSVETIFCRVVGHLGCELEGEL